MQVFLRVPYEHRRIAKAAGAHWSPSCKRWYVIDRISYRNCKQWHLPETLEVRAWLDDDVATQRHREALLAFQKAADPPPVSQRLLKTAKSIGINS